MPASQAGRGGFESRLPLQELTHLLSSSHDHSVNSHSFRAALLFATATHPSIYFAVRWQGPVLSLDQPIRREIKLGIQNGVLARPMQRLLSSARSGKPREKKMRGLFIGAALALTISTLIVNRSSASNDVIMPKESSTLAKLDSPKMQHESSPRKVVYRFDFSDYAGESIDEWLQSKGFKFEEAAKNRNELGLSIKNVALILEVREALRGFLINDSINVEKFSNVRIEWGVIKYPEGASYEKQVNNEALMVYIFFGHEKIPSGQFALPDSPYFIGLYLCKDDKINVPYKGKYYHQGGRFVCVGNPKPLETVISEFDLATAFRTYFEKDEVPGISAIAFGVDTTASGDGGTAA